MSRGLLELDVPLRMKTGPTVMLRMKAVLLTPDLQLSSSTLAFGPVQTGKCKASYDRLNCLTYKRCHLTPCHAVELRSVCLSAGILHKMHKLVRSHILPPRTSQDSSCLLISRFNASRLIHVTVVSSVIRCQDCSGMCAGDDCDDALHQGGTS